MARSPSSQAAGQSGTDWVIEVASIRVFNLWNADRSGSAEFVSQIGLASHAADDEYATRSPPYQEFPLCRLKKAASTVDGQSASSRPPPGPVRNPCTAPGGMNTRVPGPTSSAGSASV